MSKIPLIIIMIMAISIEIKEVDHLRKPLMEIGFQWHDVPGEFKTYRPLIEYARYTIYMKMAANKVWDGRTMFGTIDSLYYGVYNLKFDDCVEKDYGLMIYFSFMRNGERLHKHNDFPPLFHYSSSICFFQKDFIHPRFVYGDPEIIMLTEIERPDTLQLLDMYYSGIPLNRKFKKMLEDSIILKKGK